MNKPNRQHLEAELSNTYRGQITLYQQLVALASKLEDAFQNDLETQDTLLEMSEVMERIVQSNNDATDTRSAWDRFHQKPGPTLAKEVSSVEKLIRNLMEIVARAEAVAVQAKERLRPKLESEYKQLRMKNAYSQA